MSDVPRNAPSTSRATSESEFLDLTTNPCGICGPSTCDEQMIGCDSCAKWFHSRCVGVAEDSALQKWYCQSKACQQEYQKQQKDAQRQTRSKKAVEESDKPSAVVRKGTSDIEQRMKELEEKRKRQDKELEAEMQLQQMERRMQRDFERKKLEMEIRLRDEEEEERRALHEEILQKKRMQIERMKASQRSFEQQVADLDRELKELSVIKTPKVVAKQSQRVFPSESKNDALKQDQANTNKLARERDAVGEFDDDEYDEDSECSQHTNPFSGNNTPQNCTKVGNASRNRLGQQAEPTRAQLVARSGLTTKLPKFSGHPRQWPLFYASYKASNDACGYMNHENLVRLQECLEGRALELVAGQLLLPESVPRVIEKLRRHFGRPEQLLQEFLDQVTELEPPKPDNLKSFIPFGNTVEQLCEHLEAAGLRHHLVNPLLIRQLVAKIPDREKREWVHYQRRNAGGEPTLRTLTDFLMEIVDDACDANVDVQDTRYQSGGVPPPRRETSEGRGVLLSHSEACSSSDISTEQRELKPCKVCQSTGHRLRHCDRFGRMPYSERLRMVIREKLCNVCLNEHGGQCKFRIRCNIGDCRERHNPLMHPVESTIGMSAHIRSDSTVIFRIVPVQLYCGEKMVTVLAFLDEGASITLVEKKLADRLGVVGVQEGLTLKWTANVKREEKNSRRMDLWASGVGDGANKLLLHDVRTVGKLMLPRQKLDKEKLTAQYAYMRELPMESYDGHPELLIGLNNIHSFAPLEAKTGTPVEPIAVRCKLGWTVYGTNTLGVSNLGANMTAGNLGNSNFTSRRNAPRNLSPGISNQQGMLGRSSRLASGSIAASVLTPINGILRKDQVIIKQALVEKAEKKGEKDKGSDKDVFMKKCSLFTAEVLLESLKRQIDEARHQKNQARNSIENGGAVQAVDVEVVDKIPNRNVASKVDIGSKTMKSEDEDKQIVINPSESLLGREFSEIKVPEEFMRDSIRKMVNEVQCCTDPGFITGNNNGFLEVY